MFKKDSTWIGLAAGLLLPLLLFIPLYLISQHVELEDHTQSLLFIGGVALNLIPMRIANKNRSENTVKGILLASFLYAILFCVYRYKVQA